MISDKNAEKGFRDIIVGSLTKTTGRDTRLEGRSNHETVCKNYYISSNLLDTQEI